MITFNSIPISTDEDTNTKVHKTDYSVRAFLAGLGAKLKALDIFTPIAQKDWICPITAGCFDQYGRTLL